VLRDSRERLDAVRSQHPGEHPIGIGAHSFAQQTISHRVPVSLALLGLGLREGCRQKDPAHALRIATSELHDDLPTHRQPADDDVLDAEMIEEGSKVRGKGA
jgi:hypothetical protein